MTIKEPIRVTDHAVLRFIERFMDFDVEVVRAHIASVCAVPAAIGAVCVRADGVKYEVRNNTVITVTADGTEPSRTTKQLNQSIIARTKSNEGYDYSDDRAAARRKRMSR